MDVSKELIKTLPYINPIAVDEGRTIWLGPVYKGNQQWEICFPTENKLISIPAFDCSQTVYLGQEKAIELDTENELVSLIIQHLNSSQNMKCLTPIIDDLYNFETIKQKIEHYKSCDSLKGHVNHFVITDLEYLIFVLRSFYDLNFNIAKSVLSQMINLQTNEKIIKGKLPGSFRKIILKDNSKVFTAEEMFEKWGIPLWLGNVFASQKEFFPKLRWLRDQITHGNEVIGSIFSGENEILVSLRDKPYKSYEHIWSPELINENKLAPINIFIDYLIENALDFSNNLAISIRQNVALPSPTFPEHKIFVRGRISLKSYFRKSSSSQQTYRDTSQPDKYAGTVLPQKQD